MPSSPSSKWWSSSDETTLNAAGYHVFEKQPIPPYLCQKCSQAPKYLAQCRPLHGCEPQSSRSIDARNILLGVGEPVHLFLIDHARLHLAHQIIPISADVLR